MHKTGDRIPIIRNESRIDAETTEDDMTEAAVTNNVTYLIQAEEVCDEAISDFFAENVLTDAYSFEEIDSNVVEIKDLRTEYKRLHRQLKVAVEDYETGGLKPKYDEICQKVTDYIKNAKLEKKTRADRMNE